MSSSDGICIGAIKLTKERLLKDRDLIDQKIVALDIVLETFEDDDTLPKVKRGRKKKLIEEDKRPLDKQDFETVLKTVTGAIEGKNKAAVEIGRLGGLKGGKARSEKLTPQERSAIAKKGAEARWGKKGEVEILKDNDKVKGNTRKEEGSKINYEDMA